MTGRGIELQSLVLRVIISFGQVFIPKETYI